MVNTANTRNPKRKAQHVIQTAVKKRRIAQQVNKNVGQIAQNKASNNPPYSSRAVSFIKKGGKFIVKGRPGWYLNTVRRMSVNKGQHRRHIIPSHLLLDSFVNYINSKSETTITKEVNAFIKKYKVPTRRTNLKLADKLKAVAKYNHNNLKNLFPEDGAENSAIGLLPKGVKNIIDKADKDVKNQSVSFLEQKLENLKNTGFRFVRNVQSDILDNALKIIKQMKNRTYQNVKLFLRDELIPNLELDLNKEEGLPNQNEAAMEIYKKLDKLRFGEIGTINFFDVMDEFHNLPQN